MPRPTLRSASVLLAVLAFLCTTAPASADIPAGSFDPSWDGDGLSITSMGADVSRAHAAVLQPDGKTVVAGWSRDLGLVERFAVVRHTTSGGLDQGFDNSGRAETPIPGASDAKAFAIARQGDGKLVVAGSAIIGGQHNWAVVRYNENGSLDGTFSGDGIVSFPMGDADCKPAGYWGTAAYGVALQGAKIVLAGCAREGLRTKFALARLNPDGSLDDGSGSDQNPGDTTFGTAGKVFTDVTNTNDRYAYAMSLLADGSGVAVGGFAEAGTDVPTLVRYGADGGGAVITTVPFAAGARIIGLARQADGKIVAAGPAGNPVTFGVMRFTPGGALDVDFNGGNPRQTSFPQGGSFAGGVVLQPGGKVIVAGRVNNGNDTGFGLVRYTSSGTEDPTFGSGGVAFLPTGTPSHCCFDQVGVVVQGDGKIVVAGPGGAGSPGGGNFAAARAIPETILTDVDGDGVLDRNDNCVSTPNTDQADQEGDGAGNACDADDDNDGVADEGDNCAATFNPDQGDLDRDGQGDACDADDDNDGVPDASDNCGRNVNSDQRDSDRDGAGAACDENDGDAEPFNVSINQGAVFTSNPRVKVSIVAPAAATAVVISNDGGFGASRTFPVRADRTYDWELDSSRRDVTKNVYVRLMGPGVGNRTEDDDIVLDRTRPVFSIAKLNNTGTRLSLKARDPSPGTGVDRMQVTTNPKRPGKLIKFTTKRKTRRGTKRVFVRVRDKAGNFSLWALARRGNRKPVVIVRP